MTPALGPTIQFVFLQACVCFFAGACLLYLRYVTHRIVAGRKLLIAQLQMCRQKFVIRGRHLLQGVSEKDCGQMFAALMCIRRADAREDQPILTGGEQA
jgi:hypothetical protein